ncbi:hypothetical protein K469DRAFT_348786 [Zopfia rhizophila CBS 207.26]|uniref:Uncharacterized protein n=1 Tax=Zopfia rhizophila CBS 207.26 TaxID=1314779 RepID=A0A6A6DES6_9PEZI|nr:hypothetical protein K469DRAFT_348786 [Zopfia rhizophila CBS 207.26]
MLKTTREVPDKLTVARPLRNNNLDPSARGHHSITSVGALEIGQGNFELFCRLGHLTFLLPCIRFPIKKLPLLREQASRLPVKDADNSKRIQVNKDVLAVQVGMTKGVFIRILDHRWPDPFLFPVPQAMRGDHRKLQVRTTHKIAAYTPELRYDSCHRATFEGRKKMERTLLIDN